VSEESNVCEICGGWLRIAYTIEFRQCTPYSISVDPQVAPAPFKLCPGHPEPATKHDGHLDDMQSGGMVVQHYLHQYRDGTQNRVRIVEDRGPYTQPFSMNPIQSLSLRDWLIQEAPELERLAKEQE